MQLANRLAVVMALAIGSLPLGAAHALDREPRLTQPNAQGNRLYIVDLREDVVEGEDARDEPAARSTRDPANATDFRGWHKPKVRRLVTKLEREYGVTATSMTSYALPSFGAYLAENVVQRLRSDARVDKVIPTYEAADFSQAAPWANQVVGGETIPWGKSAIGTNDTLGASNIVYMIDAGMPPAHNDLANIVAIGLSLPLRIS